MHRLRDGLDVVDGAEDVGGVRAGDQFGLRRHQLLQDGEVHRWIRRGFGGPPFQIEVLLLGDIDPGGEVGFVVEFRADDLVAGGEFQGEGEVTEQLGC